GDEQRRTRGRGAEEIQLRGDADEFQIRPVAPRLAVGGIPPPLGVSVPQANLRFDRLREDGDPARQAAKPVRVVHAWKAPVRGQEDQAVGVAKRPRHRLVTGAAFGVPVRLPRVRTAKRNLDVARRSTQKRPPGHVQARWSLWFPLFDLAGRRDEIVAGLERVEKTPAFIATAEMIDGVTREIPVLTEAVNDDLASAVALGGRWDE